MVKPRHEDQLQRFQIEPAQALLGAKLRGCHRLSPLILWHILRGLVIFEIWKSRNELAFDEVVVSSVGMICRIWHQLRVYLQVEWGKLVGAVKQGKLSLVEIRRLFYRDFGGAAELYTVEGLKL